MNTRVTPSRGSSGFTLLELLVVLGILGILMGVFGVSYLRSIRAAEVREGANQIAADLRAARSSAQRRSESAAFKWDAGTKLTSYKLETPAGSTARVRSLPSGVTFCSFVTSSSSCAATAGTITYSAPYGEIGGSGTRLLVESTTANVPKIEVRIVGVTGRVMITGAP